MEQVIVTDVNAEDIPLLWEKVSPYLQEALDQGQGEYKLEDIYNRLLFGSMTLWIMYDKESNLLASAVCEMHLFPQRKICYVILTGGDTIANWPYAMTAIEAWALENGADAVAAYARRGITKLLSGNEFKEVYSVVQKELSDRRLH